MFTHALKARWQSAFGFNPSTEHLELLGDKLAKDLKVEEYISIKLTDDDLIVILKQVAKKRTGNQQSQLPLVLEVDKDGNKIAELQFPIKVTTVDHMFRHKNLMASAGGSGGAADNLNPSNEPKTNHANFIFVHGYNVNPDQAKGWNAEMFKRMYWSGSMAKFYCVTWYGADTQVVDAVTIDYHSNVEHALATAEDFAAFVKDLPGRKVVAAHSLGNVLVSSAIQDYSLSVDTYFMVDAAMAQEALKGDLTPDSRMTHSAWTNIPTELYCSEWYKLFNPASDKRSQLTWRGRFANVLNTHVYNFYSSGEEVLDNPDELGNPSVWSLISSQGHWAWVLQELTKGRSINDGVLGSTYGGWGFSDYWSGKPVPTVQYNGIELMLEPYFKKANLTTPPAPDLILYSTTSAASTYAGIPETRSQLLSEMVPARTLAVGRNPLDGLGFGNQDMESLKNGWPTEREGNPDWRHSDVYNVSYPYVRKVFDGFVFLGELYNN